ncbi:DeoR/GlpR family DNA-binding transcription regulator [Streptomyces sp. NBC_01808]|uniref:DeoR/GlpR family DNA-binding transcription regulator n=1 Tax=Streptomyces sp. NBC_01808 TaxID=2975947 RepID=UPI002DDA8678|nr:DeoR/GlpR family DNA-binding transcription regulator [Streptomyces sp. NBC_01808]WSA41929.1 DeoR/GlpR family DNA-binding transcription regulator [Streptomyces sp. NBC_01808]
MNQHERHGALLRLLAERGRLDVEAVAVEVAVSAATIRRDLDQLAEQQLLVRTRGGAVPNDVAYDLPLRHRAGRDAAEKERIGRAAAAMVERGMVVGLNGGTTTAAVARALAARADWGDGEGDGARGDGQPAVTVVTNALNIAAELAVRRSVKVVVSGGVAMPSSYELVGPLAGHILREIRLDIAFVGADAVDAEHGASARDEHEASINALLAAQAAKLVVVADSTKLGVRTFARICPPADIDVLVTDDRAADRAREFEEQGMSVVRA